MADPVQFSPDNLPFPRTVRADGLVLRPWRENDAGALFALASDPLIGPPAGWPPHTSVEESRQVIREVFSAPGTYCVTLADDTRSDDAADGASDGGTIVGCAGFKPTEDFYAPVVARSGDHAALDLGYWLGRRYWHHGYATKAARALLDLGFGALGLDAVYATHNTGNTASGAVMARLGMREAGRVDHVAADRLGEDVFNDEIICRISAEEWKGARQVRHR